MKQESIEARVAEKVKELGRKLTPQELIEVINEPDEEQNQEIVYEIDEEILTSE